MKILLGTDPELFVQDKVTKKYISAHDLIPGTKDDPYIVRLGAVQVDGVAAEFNTNPAETENEFVRNIRVVKDRLTAMVQEKNSSYHLVADPVATFNQDYFDSLPEEAKMLGCTPDFNAYTGERNDPPGTSEPFRTGSGHIHFGYTEYADPNDKKYIEECCEFVRHLDAVLYPASLTWDSDQKRRSLYGAPGAFRPKSYGLEYRVLSNAWVQNETLTRMVYRLAKGAADLYFNQNINLSKGFLHD